MTRYIKDWEGNNICWQRKTRLSFFSLASALVIVAYSYDVLAETIYKCHGKDGSVIFSQSPCGKVINKLEIETYEEPATDAKEVPAVDAPKTPSEVENNKVYDDYNEGLRERLAVKKWNRKRKNLENRMKALEKERDKLISEINEELNDSWDHQENYARRMRIQDIKDEYRLKINDAERALRNHRATKP